MIQFGNDVDTNVLLERADMFISPLSAVLFQPLLKKKPVFYYDAWNVKNEYTIFDDCKGIIKASSKEEKRIASFISFDPA